MNDTTDSKLLVLESGIFPDSKTVEQAIRKIDGYRIKRVQLNAAPMSPDDWDQALAEILESEKVVTL